MVKNILLVDDEQVFSLITKSMLEEEGFTVDVAFDGMEALAKIKQNQPDVVILDVMLPKIEGTKLCRLLKFDENYSSIPIILLSALSQEDDKQIGLSSGADYYLTKPFNKDVLLSVIQKVSKSFNSTFKSAITENETKVQNN